MEERPHWNDEIPGSWSGVYRLDQVGSYVSRYLESKRGVYRLIGLAEAGNSKPAVIDRICGRDETGTLYIGCEGKNFAVQSRPSKLVRSLRAPRHGNVFNNEHHAGHFLRRNFLLTSRFPPSKLAVAWCYDPNPYLAEGNLLVSYMESLGEAPPLNGPKAQDWIYPETMSSIPPR
jgi:hypothetical protein